MGTMAFSISQFNSIQLQIGHKVPTLTAGKGKSLSGSIGELLSPHKTQLFATNKEKITEQKILELCDPNSGSHVIN